MTEQTWLHRRAFRWFALLERNIKFVTQGSSYGWLLGVSVIESLVLLYSLALGFGPPRGTAAAHDYAVRLACGLAAVTAMDAAWAEGLFTFFGKLSFARFYRPILNTPTSASDLVLGEVITSVLRAVLQVAAFCTVATATGYLPLSRCPALIGIGVIAGAVFATTGVFLGTWLRSWEDFDLIGAIQFILLLGSGVFFPTSVLPHWLSPLVVLSPLYHAVELARGASGWPATAHWAVLITVGSGFLILAARRAGYRMREF